MNDDRCQVIRHPAARAFEDRALRTQVTNVAFAQNGRNVVSGASLATLAAALAACGGGGSGGPAAPVLQQMEEPENNAPTATPATGTAREDGDPATGGAVGSDPDGDDLTYAVTQGTYGTLVHDADGWTYTITDSDEIQALGVGETLSDEATIEVSDGDGATATATITITITGVNDAPSISTAFETADAARDGGVDPDGSIPEDSDGTVAGGGVLALVTFDDADTGDADSLTFEVSDKRFELIDAFDRKWLKLKDGASIDHETEPSITVTVTATDDGEPSASASTEVTITVTDVNEAPMASGELPAVTGTAGKALAGEQTRIDLGMFFSDPDGDDLTYTASGHPSWLTFEVDPATGHGVLSGTPPSAGPDADAVHTVAIMASDGEFSASRSFTLVVDDGNNPITDILFANPDGTDNPLFEISVDENTPGDGMLLGTFSAEDADSPDHPNGTITWSLEPSRWSPSFEIDKDSGELRLKQGVSLNFEALPSGSFREIKLEVKATDGGDPALSPKETLFIAVKDANDAPEAAVDAGINVGWWVTRDSSLLAGVASDHPSYADQGEWLSFSLEEPDDQRPAFTDFDANAKLKYSLVNSPSWLRIDESDGMIENVAGMIAQEGLYTVTVRATDGISPDPAEFTFQLAVAESRFTGGQPTPADNRDPFITPLPRVVSENASGGDVIATFTVQDDELPVGPVHPWGRQEVHVTAAWGASPGDVVAQVGERAGQADHFTVHNVGTTGNTARYEVRLTDLGASLIDADTVTAMRNDVDFTIRAADGTAATEVSMVPNAAAVGADFRTVNVRFNPVNEAPEYMADGSSVALVAPPGARPGTIGTIFRLDQAEDNQNGRSNVTRIYLNLTDMFQDPEDADSNVTFEAVVGDNASSWLSLLSVYNAQARGMMTGPQRWGDIMFGRNGVLGGGDDITWGMGSYGTANDPGSDIDDMVLILEVDRNASDGKGSIAQDADGRIVITAKDSQNLEGETTIVVQVNDQNLSAPAVGTVTGGGPARQGSMLDMTFNQQRDPDFTGDEANPSNPILVRYQWVYDPNNSTGNRAVRQETTSDEDYTLRPGDVGDTVQGRVIYYELFDGEIVQSATFNGPESGNVADRPDEGSLTFNVSTRIDGGNHQLVMAPAAAAGLPGGFMDGDGAPSGGNYTFRYSWESSPNGQSLWTPFGTVSETMGTAPELRALTVPEAQQGMYVRLVVSYEDGQKRSERIESQAVKVGDIDHVPVMADGSVDTQLHIDASGGTRLTSTTTPIIPAGWTLQIGGPADEPGGSSKVEWLIGGRVVGQGREYTVSESDRGTISATVTRYDADGNLVSKATVPLPSGVTLTPNAAPVLAQAEPHYVDLGKAPDANGKYAMREGMIDLQALFTDPEGGSVAGFAVSAPTSASPGFGTDQISHARNPLDLWLDLGSDGGGDAGNDGIANRAAEGDQILLINERTGEVEYHSTQEQVDADRAAGDAGGNMITVTVTGADGGGRGRLVGADTGTTDDDMATVNLRIDAAPTGFQVSAEVAATVATPDNSGSTIVGSDPTADALKTTGLTARQFDYGGTASAPVIRTVLEHDGDEVVTLNSAGGQDNGRVVARIDVQDDNSPTHAYGQYTFTVSDDRFEVVAVPASSTGGDASQGILRLKTEQSLDYEALTGGQPPEDPTSIDPHPINLVVTATPVGSDAHDAITLGVRVNVVNRVEKTDPRATDVPGLEDDETGDSGTVANTDPNPGDDTDDTDGSGTDDDHDGGWWSASEDGLF